MADEYSLYKSENPSAPVQFNILRRETRIVNDNNNGVYSGPEIIFDGGLQAIANSNQYIDFTQSELQLPLAVEYYKSSGDDASSQDSCYLMDLKNNFAMCHSLRVTLSNNELISYSVPFRNLAMTFDVVSKLSAEQEALAIQLGIAYEDSDCFSYQSSASPYGLGVCSTDISTQVLDAANGSIVADTQYTRNEKRLKKVMMYNKSALSSGRYNSFVDSSVFQSQQDSYVGDLSTGGASIWVICKIPLAFMTDLFAKMPLIKNAMWTLQIQGNHNTSVGVNVTGTDYGGAGTLTSTTAKGVNYSSMDSTSTSTPNGFLPFRLGSTISGGGYGTNLNTNCGLIVKATVKIAQHTPSSGGTVLYTSAAPLQSCRLLLSMVTLAPEYERSYLSNPVKNLKYDDMVWKSITCAAGASFDQLVFNNVSRMRKLVMLPYTYTSTSGLPANDMVSPFSGYGSSYLSSPLARLSEFNVNISGAQLFPKNLMTISEFYNEFKQCQTLNGGAHGPDAAQNSLISLTDYGFQYGAIVIDLSRHVESIDSLTQTISLTFKNNTKMNLAFNCFLYFEKEINVNVETGQLVA